MSRVKRLLFVLLALDLLAMVGAMAMAAKLRRVAAGMMAGSAVAGLIAVVGVVLAVVRRFKGNSMMGRVDEIRSGAMERELACEPVAV